MCDYCEKSQRSDSQYYDTMLEALVKFNEAFYALSKESKSRIVDGQSFEKRMLDKFPTRDQSFLEKPMLNAFEEPFFKSHWNSHSEQSTFDRAHKLLNEMVKKGSPDINLTKEDDLFKVPEDFEDVYREFGMKGGLTGTNSQTSTITKDGKTVTVERKSKLNPDGSITIKVTQHFTDAEGHTDTMSRKKTINVKSKTDTTSDKMISPTEKKEEEEVQEEYHNVNEQ